MIPKEDHKHYLGGGTLLLQRQPGGVGVVHPGEEKAPERPYSDPPVPKGGLQESRRGTLFVMSYITPYKE